MLCQSVRHLFLFLKYRILDIVLSILADLIFLYPFGKGVEDRKFGITWSVRKRTRIQVQKQFRLIDKVLKK